MVEIIWPLGESQVGDGIVVLMVSAKIQEIGGSSIRGSPSISGSYDQETEFFNQGIAILNRWFRLNCSLIPIPVNINHETGWKFQHAKDAILFKLTWGG